VVSSQPATEETGAMGREIESRQGMGLQLKKICMQKGRKVAVPLRLFEKSGKVTFSFDYFFVKN
jgi:hypothetical protein